MGHAHFERHDKLEKLDGIGPTLAKALNGIGIFSFEQLARMDEAAYALVDELLPTYQGRGKRDNWAGQAKKRAAE